MGRIVGIDYGRARIGIALSDNQKRMALPYKMLKTSKNIKDTLIELKKIIDLLRDIEKIIIGLPLTMKGEESLMAKEVKDFGALLEKESPLPIEYFDERLSSAMADKILKNLAVNRKKRTQQSDSIAASIFLQTYLDTQTLQKS